MNQRNYLFGALICLCIGPAVANAEGFYAGGAVGWAEAEVAPGTPFVGITDDTLALVKGVGGYRVNPYLAVEGSLVGSSNDEDHQYELTFAAFTATAVGIIPVSEAFELFGKGGIYLGESEVGNNSSEDESGFLAGAGAFINIGSRRQFTVRFEYEYYDVDELDELWSFTVGFQYNFR
jgi:hypothetical protein